MFASLTGTNTGPGEWQSLFDRLCEVAVSRGFSRGDCPLHVQQDQVPLDGWSLALRGPADGQADFLLAVTAPRMPTISPIPVKKTVSGPMFAVVAMESHLLVSREDRRDVSEFRQVASVLAAFGEFLDFVQTSAQA